MFRHSGFASTVKSLSAISLAFYARQSLRAFVAEQASPAFDGSKVNQIGLKSSNNSK